MENQTGRCIHCLKFFKTLTRDHILPKSYYADSTPSEIERWTAPACSKCNAELGKIEENLLIRLGLSLNPRPDTNSSTSEISQRVLRSLNPKVAKNDRDKKIRLAKAKKMIEGIFRSDGSIKGIFPNFGYHKGWKPEEQYGIYIPANEPEVVGAKIVRGIEYRLGGRIIDPTFELQVYFCHEDTIRDVVDLIRRNGQHYIIVTGFEFYRCAPFEQKYCLYEIRIWDKFIIYASIMKKSWWKLLFSFNFWKYKFYTYGIE
jgi:hypothetical protein